MGFRLVDTALADSTISELPEAALDLLDLPYSADCSVSEQVLSDELRQLGSAEEEGILLQPSCDTGTVGNGVHSKATFDLRLGDGELPPGLMGSRVDFALQMSRVRWVFEVDGAQHVNERDQDARRDRTLQQAGWKVFRVSAATVRSNPVDWLTEVLNRADIAERKSLDAKKIWGSVSFALEHSPVHRAAWHTILMPLAVQRCLRGLLMLYRHGALEAGRTQRLLVVEEDTPAVADAFRMLLELWESIHSLSPELGARPPLFSLDVIGPRPLSDGRVTVRHVDEPEGEYDAVISHSLLLLDGRGSPRLEAVAPELADGAIRLRRAIGGRTVRHLLPAQRFHYNFDPDADTAVGAMRQLLRIVFRKHSFRDGQLRAIGVS